MKEEYVDNIFWSSTDKNKDAITTLSPGLELTERTEKANVELLGNIDFRIYGENKDLDAVDQNYMGSMDYRFSPKFSIASEAKFVEDSKPDRDLESSGILLGNLDRKRYYGNLLCDYQFSEITSGNISYVYEQDDYDEEDLLNESVSDLKAHSIFLTASRDLSLYIPNLLGQLTVSSAKYSFSNQKLDQNYVMGNAKWGMNEKMVFALNLGILHTRTVFTDIQFDPISYQYKTVENAYEQTGWVGQTAISYQGEKIFSQLSYSYDVKPASGRNGATQRENFKLMVSRRFTYEFFGYLYIIYYSNKANAFELATNNINEDTFSIIPTLQYSFSTKLALEGACGYTKILDKLKSQTVNRSSIYIKLSYNYEMLK